MVIDMVEKEYIDRSEALAELEKVPHLKLAGSIIKSIKASDVVEVVRCKDCCYHFEDKNGYFDPENIFCGRACDNGFKANDYCSYGIRGSVL
jgi:hypothetical protein